MLALLAGVAAVPAMAQTECRIEFSSPFAFTAGLATLPAGSYTITKQGDTSGIYAISSRTNAVSAMVIARTGESVASASKPSVSFTQRDGKFYLDSVAMADGSVVVVNNASPTEARGALMVRKVRMVK
jgi:hypothetical protein